MKWLRRKRKEDEPSRSDEALAESREQLGQVRREGRHWEDFAQRMRRMREENHLAEKFRDALEGR